MIKTNSRLAILYGLTIFLSAFLLFQVQPMIGKMILPWFGGSASVWTTCMLFFQVLLLLGYSYTHLSMSMLSPKRQSYLHIGMMIACLLCLPLVASPEWKPTGAENPTLRILLLLLFTIGLPYFVLSTTGPLIQAWFAREQTNAVPYRLFALSNLGSFLALLAYPALVEPNLPTRWQSYGWSLLFVCFVLSCSVLAWRGCLGRSGEARHAHSTPPPSLGAYLSWTALAACPSIMMVADTSFLTENVAPIPLLWIAPLALYLLSFILCFERKGTYQRRWYLQLLIAGIGAMAYLPTLGLNFMPLVVTMAINLASFFVICMVCHGELADMQPNPAYLTNYYLMLAAGGACGGLFVGLVAPYFFNSNYEYSIGILLTSVVVSSVVIARHSTPRFRKIAWIVAPMMILAIAYIRISDHIDELSDAKLLVRNFYGAQGVFDVGTGLDAHRTLMHGQIIHGKQFTSPERLDWPTTYYSQESGVGRALVAKATEGPLKVGVVGLGAGTLASYGRKGDSYRMYDIDPLVIKLAQSEFSFLSRSKAHKDIVLGDARLSLEKEAPQQFDVLVIDAFSGDSVPVHLLTREAFKCYFGHLKPDGVLAIHVTNRFLNLPPVVKTVADSFGKTARLVATEGDRSREIYRSLWVVVANDSKFFQRKEFGNVAKEIDSPAHFRLWTDDYSSIFSVLK